MITRLAATFGGSFLGGLVIGCLVVAAAVVTERRERGEGQR